jgi:chemotaxis protein methyltransferase CheR
MNRLAQMTESFLADFGLVLRSGWQRDLERASHEMTSHYKCNIDQLAEKIDGNPNLLREFAGYFTVEETHFLRHPEHFDFLAQFIKDRLSKTASEEKIVIWSAGCSSGEEPYSSAIVIHELGSEAENRVDILANDVCRPIINKASDGIYRAWSFRGTPPWFLARYFDSTNGDGCRLSDAIRKLVQFENLSIEEYLSKLPNNSVDVIFFRNVAIYFDRESIERIYKGFRRVIKDSGALIVAPADPRPSADLYKSHGNKIPGIYRIKQDGAKQVTPLHPFKRDLSAPAVKRESTAGGLQKARTSYKRNLYRLTGPAKGEGFADESPPIKKTSTRDPSANQKAVDLGDQGEIERAIGIAGEMIKADPSSSVAYLLRGQIHLSGMFLDSAVTDLRRAVFLGPDDRIARFWYAEALRSSGLLEQAVKQFSELENKLASNQNGEILEDGQTSAGELLKAVKFVAGSLE